MSPIFRLRKITLTDSFSCRRLEKICLRKDSEAEAEAEAKAGAKIESEDVIFDLITLFWLIGDRIIIIEMMK